MVYAIIGHPFSGKSTFVKKVFLKDNSEYKGRYYVCDNTIILGNYNEDNNETDSLKKRHVGIDRIHYEKGELFNTIKQFVDKGYGVVVEGIKLFRGDTLKSLKENNIDTTLFLIDCDTSTIIKRSKDYPVLKNSNMIDGNKMRLLNLFNKYKDSMNGKIINTENFTDEDYQNVLK